ncbi:hypothetical protein [Paenibacillus alginolyticus]|uniref:Uncharacterized protein n=1 Tax=Paenibacillus alginolyticus TaxID=59839 RepID=A0ABT4GQ34_9BACL|nr:hypothetical protein [Paenibacillus alginolyticus]MCY9698317.1 hypothetical protein [Paenibacillus alginolyticus]MEC0142717.1 hypothetical protein [Paenibacillus alginolyticus]
MLPKVYNVKSIILLSEKGERDCYSFERIIFETESCYLVFKHDSEFYVYKLNLAENQLFMDPAEIEYIEQLSKTLSIDIKQDNLRHWAVGISYNETSSENKISTLFKISNQDQPLDILPFLLQTGEDSIYFRQ